MSIPPPIRLFACLLLAALIGACATRPPLSGVQRDAEWRRHRDQVAGLEQWGLKGRIAIRLQQEGWSASLHWRQRRADYAIRLIGPLGNGMYELRGSDGMVQLQTPDDRLLQAPDAAALLQETLGWQVPVDGLRYWVRGLPAPGSEPQSMALDERGRLQSLEQDGWQVHYSRYGLFRGGLVLPEKLTLERRDLRLRLSIHAWEI
jgi:outer membrane lipoprotein LolB